MADKKASTGLIIASALCLGALVFAVLRIVLGGGGEELGELWSYMDGWPVSFVLWAMSFGAAASAYVLLTRRRPKSVLGAQIPEERRYPKSPVYWVAVAVLCILLLTILGVIIWI